MKFNFAGSAGPLVSVGFRGTTHSFTCTGESEVVIEAADAEGGLAQKSNDVYERNNRTEVRGKKLVRDE